MGGITPNLKLNVPDFDQIPWDTDVNTNWQVLDATVGLFTAIPNLTGVWQNSHAYSVGQSAVDPADSSIWMCQIAHTSSAKPTTFAQDRMSAPARWSLTTPGASFYASQAAASAAAAAASATAAANSAASAAGKLPLSGGTMTGNIVLVGDPTANLHPATRQYVDARVGGTGYLPVGGGTLTGQLIVPNVKYSSVAAADQHGIAFGYTAGVLYAIQDGALIGSLATQAYTSGNFLPLSGGTVTGNLLVQGEMQAAALFRIPSTGAYFHSDTFGTNLVFNASGGVPGWRIEFSMSAHQLQYITSGGANYWSIDASGNMQNQGSHVVGVDVIAGGNLTAKGGKLTLTTRSDIYFQTDNATYTRINFLGDYNLVFLWTGTSAGSLAWFNGSNFLFDIDSVGNVTAAGSVFADNVGLMAADIASIKTRLEALEAK